ncbi:MAG: hypothetical protein ACRC0Q_11090 [Kurthia gibsonii]
MEKQMFNYTPESIQLLFDNPKLEIAKILCLLNALAEESKKQRTVEEILFYYTITENEGNNIHQESSIAANNFYRFEIKISKLLIVMSTLEFIKINAKITDKFEKIKLKLLSKGRKFFEENQTKYFIDLFNEYKSYIERIPFSVDLLKKIKEEGKY